MNRLNVFRSTTRTPSARISSVLHPVATISGLGAAAEEFVTTTVQASTAVVSLDRGARPRTRSAQARRLLWAKVQPVLSVGDMVAERGPAVALPGQAHMADRRGQAHMAEPAAIAATAGDVAADAAPAAASPKPPSAISRVELTIDSLRNYELIKPIPVVVESLGERNYVAEMPDLNISTSAGNPSDILITLKDRIAQVYDGLRIKKNLDAEQSRQLRLLETYIGKSRRSWLDRR
jgi:hypothetical protein